MTRLSVDAIEELARSALLHSGANEAAATSLARAIAAAERDGIASHGLTYLAVYCEHLACGKVLRDVTPRLQQTAPAALSVDAGAGFAHPAIDTGFASLVPLARSQGLALLGVHNSYNCGVLGYHTERLACEGLLALGFTNAPASIAASGGRRPLFGTNPWSVAAPDGKGGAALVIDQSASVVAKSEVMKKAREGNPIPLGWALGPDGEPTTDPKLGLTGTMVPAGGYKGVGSALLVELMAACLAGATLGAEASPFAGTVGGPPRTGQLFIAVAPQICSQGEFGARLKTLLSLIGAEEGTHLPGSRRKAAREKSLRDGVLVDETLLEKAKALAMNRVPSDKGL